MGPPGEIGPPGVRGEHGFSAMVTAVAPVVDGPCAMEGGAQVTGGDGSVAYVCNGKAGTAARTAMSTSNLFLNWNFGVVAPVTPVPDLALPLAAWSSTTAAVVTTDGGIQVSSQVPGAFVIVDVFLIVDVPATATSPAISKQIGRQRVMAVNPTVPDKHNEMQPGVASWSFSAVDTIPAPGAFTYKVAAQIVGSSGPMAVVGGGPALTSTVPHLRGTLTAVFINK
jgi:hypothetical protein